VLSYNIDVATSSVISKGDRKSMGYDGLNHFFTVIAFKKIHLLLIGWSFAIFACIICFLLDNLKSPNTILNKNYSRDE